MTYLCIKMEQFTIVSLSRSAIIESYGWLNKVKKHEITSQSHSCPMDNQWWFHYWALCTLLDPMKLNIKEKHASINNNNFKNITMSSNPNKIDLTTHNKVLQYRPRWKAKLPKKHGSLNVVASLASRFHSLEIYLQFFWGFSFLDLIRFWS